MRKTFWVLILSLMLIAITTSGCAGKSKPTVPEGKEGPGKSEEQMRVSVVLKSLNHVFWRAMEKGAKDAGQQLGAKVEVLGPSAETRVEEQVNMIEDQITKGVSALVIAPSQPKAQIPVFERAKSKNIPVVFIDTDAPWESKVSFIGTGNFAAGKQAGEILAKHLTKGAKVAIIRGALGDLTHDERANGAVEALKAAGIEVVTIQPANSDRQMAMSVMENILQANPNIQGVFATNDEMGLGAVKAIEGSGKIDKIVVVVFDASPSSLNAVIEGKLAAVIAQDPYKMGYKGVETAIRAKKGEQVEKRIDTGVKIITKENAKEELKEFEELAKLLK